MLSVSFQLSLVLKTGYITGCVVTQSVGGLSDGADLHVLAVKHSVMVYHGTHLKLKSHETVGDASAQAHTYIVFERVNPEFGLYISLTFFLNDRIWLSSYLKSHFSLLPGLSLVELLQGCPVIIGRITAQSYKGIVPVGIGSIIDSAGKKESARAERIPVDHGLVIGKAHPDSRRDDGLWCQGIYRY